MKKLFLYMSLFVLAFWTGYLISHEKYKDYHYDYELLDTPDVSMDNNINIAGHYSGVGKQHGIKLDIYDELYDIYDIVEEYLQNCFDRVSGKFLTNSGIF